MMFNGSNCNAGAWSNKVSVAEREEELGLLLVFVEAGFLIALA